MFLSGALDWLEEAGESVVHAATGIIAGAEHLIEGGVGAVHGDVVSAVSAVHDDLRDVVHWGGAQAEKGEDLFASVVDSAEDVVSRGVQEMGAVAEKVVDDTSGLANNLVGTAGDLLSTPLMLVGGGVLAFLLMSGRNSGFRL